MNAPSQYTLTLNAVQWDMVLGAVRTAVQSQDDLLKLTAKHRGDMSDSEYVDTHRQISNRKLSYEQLLDLLRTTLTEQSSERPDFHVA